MHFYKKLPSFYKKNCLGPTYKKPKPRKSAFIKNSSFEINRDPWVEFGYFEGIAHLSFLRDSSNLKPWLVFKSLFRVFNCCFFLRLFSYKYLKLANSQDWSMSGAIKDVKKNFSLSSNFKVDNLISGPLEWKTLSSGDLYLIFLLRDVISNDSLNKRSSYEKFQMLYLLSSLPTENCHPGRQGMSSVLKIKTILSS